MVAISRVGRFVWLTAKSSGVLWWAGVRESLQLQRCVRFFMDSPAIAEKTTHCFVLNVCIFTGSIGFLKFALEPVLNYLLTVAIHSLTRSAESGSSPDGKLPQTPPFVDPEAAIEALHSLPSLLFHTLWLLPMYILSFIVNCRWYSEIATTAVQVLDERRLKQRVLEGRAAPGQPQPRLPSRREPLPIASFLAQEIYKLLLFFIFFVQVVLLSFVPMVGTLLYFVMTSVLYAFYCFDYKWGMQNEPLSSRVAVIESNWAFFAGFGSLCVLCSMVLPFYIGAGVVNFVYPLFVLVACETDIRAETETGRRIVPALRLPWFSVAQRLTDGLVQWVGPRRRRAKQQ